MTLDEVMRELEQLGTEQTRKTYRRHGAPEPLFGVSFADLGRLTRRIRTDQALAGQLWATGNTDARTLATMVADPASFTPASLDAWLSDLRYPMLIDVFVSQIASKNAGALEAMKRWTASEDEWTGRAGWDLVGRIAMDDAALPDVFFEERLAVIEAGIHGAKNRARAAMNDALIAIGGRSEGLREKAIAAAQRIGKVEVDHGDTACKTPDAVPAIEKMWARKRERAAPAAKKVTAKKATAKKAAPKKATAKKATAKRAPAKKATTRKAAPKKATARKAAPKKKGRAARAR